MKKLIILSLLLLTACNANTQVVTKREFVVPTIDAKLYQCPMPKKFSDINNITDAKIAKIILDLYKNNIHCRENIKAIQKVLEDAKSLAL